MNLAIINGPNLNLLGSREPEIYGTQSFSVFFEKMKESFPAVSFQYFQSNVEGELINFLQQAGFSADGIILNAGGYTHTSVAIADCIASIKAPVVEVHISNIAARESFRQHSLLAARCRGFISGFGLNSYHLAVMSFLL